MSARGWAAAVLMAAVSLPGGTAAGQSLVARVQQVRDGTVRFHFDARPGVEVCDQGIRIGPHSYIQWRSRSWDDDAGTNCHAGFLEVEIGKQDGGVRDVRIVKRFADRTEGATDVGAVQAQEAVRYLLSIARASTEGRVAEHALLPAALADASDTWRGLMDIARDRSVREGVRKSALFWVSREAGEVVTRGLADVADADDETQGLRDAAVFALSQRPDSEGVPALMELARTAAQAKTRKTALFWLAQSNDSRVLPFFRQILVGKQGG